MVVGEPIPVIWGRRRGDVGGVLVFPRATEARFENTATTVTSRYHMVLGDGRIPDIQRRDVRLGECRIGSFSQNYNQRAGSWAPGNLATAQTGYTVPTFSNYTGGGGNYLGLSTFEAGVTVPGGSDDWRTGWNVFLRGGTIVERGRLLDSAVDSSDNIADLALWALQRSGQVPDAMIDFPSFIAAAQFTEANGLWCNGGFSGSTNLGDWLIGILPQFLLRETKIAGRFGLRPLVPTNSDGTINTGAIAPAWVLTEASIKPGSYQISFSDAASSRPTPLAMLWRQQHDDTDVPIVRTLIVGDPNAPGPPEQHDLSQFATTENHAAKVGVYRFTRRTLSTHSATVALKPGAQTGNITEGDIVQIYLLVTSNREQVSVINKWYTVESIGHNLIGEETLSLSHFPVYFSGQSHIALAVAAAAGTGTILPSNRTGSSCDLPGAAADTSVPAKTTSGTPFSASSGGGGVAPGVDPYGTGGPPMDSPPPPTDGSKAAGNDGIIPPGNGTNSAGGDARCPNGYNRVTGYTLGGGVISGIGLCGPREGFVATSFPSVDYVGKSNVWSFTLETWRVRWIDPDNGPQERNVNSVISNVPSDPFDCVFEIGAYSYSCELDDGSAGPTVSNASGAPILYRTKDGDTMRNISERFYGTPNRAEDIQNANPWLMGLDNWALGGQFLLTMPN
jgi:nucleoid-associated protein YgaU